MVRILTSKKIREYNKMSFIKFKKKFPNAISCSVGMSPIFGNAYSILKSHVIISKFPFFKTIKFWKKVRQEGRINDDGYTEWFIPIFN